MAWVFYPGYGIWPRMSRGSLSRDRIIGQASMDFLGQARPPIRWPNMSPEGMKAHRQFAEAFGADPDKRHGFDALLELVEEDQRSFENPTPRQAQDQAQKMAETVRELARMGIAHEVDWLTFTSPEIRNGKPTVVVGVKPSVVVGRSTSGVPLVSVRGKPLPVAPSKIHGRPVEFRVTTVVAQTGGVTEIAPLGDVEGDPDDDSTAVSNNWTGTRGGWYDYAGPDVTPGGADNMGEIIRLDTDVGGARLSTLLIDKLPANQGVYLRHRDNSWSFFLDPILRVRLLLRGVKTPVSVPADKLVCWNTIPTQPLVGGFTHPETGFHCRSAAIPTEWDTATHGTPAVWLTGGNGGIPNGMSDTAPATPLQRANDLAVRINTQIGAIAGDPAKWWLYTLPMVGKDGKPVVKIGVKGDYQPDAKELKALPWAQWVALGVEINVEFVPPEGSGIKGTVAKITPEGLAEAGMADDDMGSAPIDSVWPTSSPNYREPTGPATGDFDQGMGGYGPYNSACPTCGSPAVGATRCIPGAYFCANGHSWSPTANNWKAESMPGVTLSDLAQSSHGFPARWRYPSKYAQPPMLDPSRAAGIRPRPAPFADDTGMGAAPIVAMPTGMLNWDRVSGYEGQPWVTKDWSGQGFMGAETTEFDDGMGDAQASFMGDVGPSSGTREQKRGGRSLAFGALSAVLGAAAGWALAPGGDSRRGAVAGGIGGGIAGLIVGKLIGGAERAIETAVAGPKPAEPVKA